MNIPRSRNGFYPAILPKYQRYLPDDYQELLYQILLGATSFSSALRTMKGLGFSYSTEQLEELLRELEDQAKLFHSFFKMILYLIFHYFTLFFCCVGSLLQGMWGFSPPDRNRSANHSGPFFVGSCPLREMHRVIYSPQSDSDELGRAHSHRIGGYNNSTSSHSPHLPDTKVIIHPTEHCYIVGLFKVLRQCSCWG